MMTDAEVRETIAQPNGVEFSGGPGGAFGDYDVIKVTYRIQPGLASRGLETARALEATIPDLLDRAARGAVALEVLQSEADLRTQRARLAAACGDPGETYALIAAIEDRLVVLRESLGVTP